MERVLLGKTELNVSRLGYGGAPIGFLETDQQAVSRILHYLLDRGVNLIDTAALYRGSEEAIGKALVGRRDEVVLVSKGGPEETDLPGTAWSEELILASIDRSLKRLQTDYLDVFLLHTCDHAVLERGEALAAVLKAVKAGKVRHVGYSGDNAEAAFAAGLEDISVIEMSINIADQANIDSVLPRCRERDLGVIAKRPLANAAWNPLGRLRGMYRNYAEVYHKRLQAMNVTPMELGYSGHVEVEWPEIALKFALYHEGVHSAIVGTTSKTNAEANLMAAEKNPLREEVVTRLQAAFKKAEEEAGETWLGQR